MASIKRLCKQGRCGHFLSAIHAGGDSGWRLVDLITNFVIKLWWNNHFNNNRKGFIINRLFNRSEFDFTKWRERWHKMGICWFKNRFTDWVLISNPPFSCQHRHYSSFFQLPWSSAHLLFVFRYLVWVFNGIQADRQTGRQTQRWPKQEHRIHGISRVRFVIESTIVTNCLPFSLFHSLADLLFRKKRGGRLLRCFFCLQPAAHKVQQQQQQRQHRPHQRLKVCWLYLLFYDPTTTTMPFVFAKSGARMCVCVFCSCAFWRYSFARSRNPLTFILTCRSHNCGVWCVWMVGS